MLSRQRLRQVVGYMLLALAGGFAFILLSSTVGLRFSKDQATLTDLEPGQTVLRRWQQQRVWMTHLNDRQREALSKVPATVIRLNSGCVPQTQYCLLSAATTRPGVELRFVSKKPVALGREAIWEGGFINPDNGAIFDLLGRAYRLPGEQHDSLVPIAH